MLRESDELVRSAAERAARQSYGKLVALLAARTSDVAGAEDALAEAFASALTEWPAHGIPHNPEAWLLTVARRKMIDTMRHARTADAAAPHLRLLTDEVTAAANDDTRIPDRRLALLFVCAHPAIDAPLRAPLMLQTVLGFDSATIASAFLVAPATMAQRLVRAKSKIRQAGISFEIPERGHLRERLGAVLDAIYATFTEGWSDAEGTDARRRNLAAEAIWLGRLAISLLPEEPEALGLMSLMLHAEARRGARRNGKGEYVPLAEQDAAAWAHPLIAEAESLLHRAGAMQSPGRYQLEAAIQSAHAIRRQAGHADWSAIEQLYRALMEMTGSPVAALNHAIAVSETQGPRAAIALLDSLSGDKRLADYQPYWAARADLLARGGNTDAALEAYDRAIGLEADPAVRDFLLRRRQAADGGTGAKQ